MDVGTTTAGGFGTPAGRGWRAPMFQNPDALPTVAAEVPGTWKESAITTFRSGSDLKTQAKGVSYLVALSRRR
ncbi:hypothetical protein Pflav_015860 [Phytohabitans flavus]|uniref:Uncharacterized protein n=1 Tax=Phytohabitans flavus TaxID=1076124 RepID=A0A6F8XMY6_9ACTN|nr:hypothetical protein Pflav_015860 [Phytohabitans flavus]